MKNSKGKSTRTASHGKNGQIVSLHRRITFYDHASCRVPSRSQRQAIKERKALVEEILRKHEEESKESKKSSTQDLCGQVRPLDVKSQGKGRRKTTVVDVSRSEFDRIAAEEERLQSLIAQTSRLKALSLQIPQLQQRLENDRNWLQKYCQENEGVVDATTGMAQTQLDPKTGKITRLDDKAKTFTSTRDTMQAQINSGEERLGSMKKDFNELIVQQVGQQEAPVSVESFLRSKVLQSVEKNKELEMKVEHLKNEVSTLKRKFSRERGNLLRLKTSRKKVFDTDLKQALTEKVGKTMATFVLGTSTKLNNWEDKDIINALLLRTISKKAYIFLRLKRLMPLPATSTLRWYTKKLNLKHIRDISRFRGKFHLFPSLYFQLLTFARLLKMPRTM